MEETKKVRTPEEIRLRKIKKGAYLLAFTKATPQEIADASKTFKGDAAKKLAKLRARMAGLEAILNMK